MTKSHLWYPKKKNRIANTIKKRKRKKHYVETSAKPPPDLLKQLRTDLITRIALHLPQTPLLLIVIQQRPARLLKLSQPLRPRLKRVILPLRQRLPSDIVLARDLGRIETGIVDPSRRLVDPARRYPRENHRRRRNEVNDEVDWNERVETVRLAGCAGEPIEDERC